MPTFFQVLLLAVIQGLAELLPVSSSAHVIVAEKLLGLDPTTPQMTFLLVMLHTGTMFAVLFYFWRRWKPMVGKWFELGLATAVTGFLGLGLKVLIEKVILGHQPNAEVEHLFGNLPLIAMALTSAGIVILFGARGDRKHSEKRELTRKDSIWIGLVQGLCLPFRGFSRSGATISTGLMLGLRRAFSEEFSFALAVILTPPVILLQTHRLMKAHTILTFDLVKPGLVGMVFSFLAGLLALKWLSAWLERGNWRFFGYYCFFFAMVILAVHLLG